MINTKDLAEFVYRSVKYKRWLYWPPGPMVGQIFDTAACERDLAKWMEEQMGIRQIKHKGCGQIILLDITPLPKTYQDGEQPRVPETALRCPVHGIVPASDIEPQGAVCVLFTQK